MLSNMFSLLIGECYIEVIGRRPKQVMGLRVSFPHSKRLCRVYTSSTLRYPQSKTETYTGEWADGRTRFPVGCLAVRDARPKGEHDRLGLAVTLANDRMFLRFGQFIDHIYLLACLEFAGIQATNTVTP